MKHVFYLSSILFTYISCHTNTTENKILPTTSDTIFIFKDKNLGSQQSICIDHNKNSVDYKKVSYFNYSDDETYSFSYNKLKEEGVTFQSQKPVLETKNWIQLHLYKNDYYVYKSCDFFNQQIAINDTALVNWTMEGAFANKIVSQKKEDSNKYEFELKGSEDWKIKIYIIDENKKIAIFEETYMNEKPIYSLMTDANTVNQFSIIVNNCEHHKQSELDFDTINFLELLKKNGFK
ncbi:hypothetical protein HX096_04495 [Empedobacter falsenii]|uniref:hypothetical protein n=1 Tax=Empedobacter falsenii TaxID=343874 RepID=UPI002577200C|nr:hypothetical protein [Empedobacter falsenii]MDM1547114.1 hypothetical protein [Empedobacter falsenii]